MKKILVVDDQPIIRMLMRLALSDEFEIMEADNAYDALKCIHVDRPDAILLDVMMPGAINGFQLCEIIKQDADHCSIKVVLVTACSKVEDQEFGWALGANGYFLKPFSPLAIRKYLADIL